jgi:hypothetical protein
MYKGLLVATVTLVAAHVTSAWAGWGCAYDSSAGVGRNWGKPTEEGARLVAMGHCTARHFEQCRIIGCSDNVDTKADADKLWPQTPGIKYNCGGPGEPAC